MNDFRCVTVLFALLIMTTASLTEQCPWSKRTVEIVSSCPRTEDETEQSANTKKCFALADVQTCTEPKKFKYHCLPNHEQSALVEVCAPEVNISGICIVYNTEKGELHNNTNTTCRNHMQPCPSSYLSTFSHFYTSCHKGINWVSTISKILEVTSPSPNNPQNEAQLLILIIVPAFLIISIALTAVTCIYLKRRNKRQSDAREARDARELSGSRIEMAPLFSGTHWRETRHETEEPNGSNNEKKSLPEKESLPETKKNLKTDQFSELTKDDEVSVLFCFMCSDSGPPDFTDKEWLDILNEIRQKVYTENYPITSEEAQHTLDRLKSRDFLWEDQRREHLTRDTQDEIMYRVSMRVYDINFLFQLSSFITAQRYLRSQSYNINPRDKCVISDCPYNDTLLIRRLQMDILTMEDRRIFDKVTQLLNIPLNILERSEKEREEFLKTLKEKEEIVHYRGSLQDSVQHVKWLWRYGRPDIVRSCIGLHPHNDIYIIDNKAHRKPNQYHRYTPAVRCLLYGLLLVDQYTLDVNEQSHKEVLNKVRDRYFNYLAIDNVIDVSNIPEGITNKENSTITLTSEEIRHEVMYAFVTECLVEDSDLMFFLTTASRDVISEYCRTWRYVKSAGERCLYLSSESEEMENLFMDRLQMDIIIHCTISNEEIHGRISERLNIPMDIVRGNKREREEFLEKLKRTGEKVHYRGRSHVKWLLIYGLNARPDIVRSCISLHPHWDIYVINNAAYRKSNQYHQYSPAVRCLLYGLLLVDQYTLDVNKQTHKEVLNKVRERYFQDLPVYDENDVSIIPEGITNKQNSAVTLTSEEIRHDVMYAFVTECLVEDSDLKFFLTTASRDVISEYCRTSRYVKSEGERCLYLSSESEEMENLFIDRLQLDIIIHTTMSDEKIHEKIIKRLKIPEEVLRWDIAARKRFVNISGQGSVNMCRARGMIVGCAGAGKTTLLRKLQRKTQDDIQQPTETTIGLDIHEDLFEIKGDTLIDFDSKEENLEVNGTKSDSSFGRQLISMTDFAGQVAYYACHQIYLSRRAFYLVVVDMSKGLNEKALTYDTDRHNPEGSLFHGWTYEDYFVFWLQTIKTYCEDRKTKEGRSGETKANPVIIIASHHDCLKQKKGASRKEAFYDALEKCLPKKHILNDHISPARYYEIACPVGKLNKDQAEKIEQIRKCVVRTARSLPHWGEKIPHLWYMFEQFVLENKKKRILRREHLRREKEFGSLKQNEIDDMLRYFSEVGQIIYFSEKGLSHNIILDVEWFVGAFKNIITDPTHARPDGSMVNEWKQFIESGMISDSTLVKIWSDNKNDSYVHEKDNIMPYMEKLGILARVRVQNDAEKEDTPLLQDKQEQILYYIPSINTIDFTTKCLDIINNGQKTPILIFSFKTYIPHFFFFRLVAICFSKWELKSKNLLRKNIAFYKEKGDEINFAIAVNKTSIQLQAFTIDEEIPLTRLSNETKEIRIQIEAMIGDLSTTFHHQVLYEIGYPCKDIHITEEDEDCFLREETVAKMRTNRRVCPLFGEKDHENHKINRENLLHYWYTGDNLKQHEQSSAFVSGRKKKGFTSVFKKRK